MRWTVTVQGSPDDLARLREARLVDLADESGANEAIFEFHDFADSKEDPTVVEAARETVETSVARFNRLGALRWGRVFEGVTVTTVTYVDSSGKAGVVVFATRVIDHMLPEAFADMMESSGHARPPLPNGVEDVNSLDLALVDALCELEPDVARVLQLIEMALAGDEGIDWGAAYSALEVIEGYGPPRGLRGQDLGWFSINRLSRFNQMANSHLAIGIKARHQGKFARAPTRPLSDKEAEWFVRGTTARWIAWLLKEHGLD